MIPNYRALTESELEKWPLYKWILLKEYRYYSPRYKQHVVCEKWMLSDGATGAFDIKSAAWWVHDKLCKTGRWANGEKVTNHQASMVLSDILYSEGETWRASYWYLATLAFGGDEARKNGIFRL